MKNEQKKNYVQPEMTVLDFSCQATALLCFSGDGILCSEEETKTASEGESVEFN